MSGEKIRDKMSSKWALAVVMLRARTVEVREARHAFLRLRGP